MSEETFPEKDYLELCKTRTEEKLGWGGSHQWTNNDFEKLAELIFEQSKVRLSPSTLKRVWGKVKYESDPTLTTLNALAMFLGYESWRNFKSPRPQISQIKQIPQIRQSSGDGGVVRGGWSLGKAAVAGFVAILILTALSFALFKKELNPAEVAFSARAVSNELPNSVVFDYSLGNQGVKQVIIQQSWDPQRRDTVSSSGTQHTSLYYKPGFFQAKLLADGKIVKEADVFIKTAGWVGILALEPVPSYLSPAEISLAGNSMEISAAILQKKTGKTVFNDVWTEFYNVNLLDVDSSDSLEFSVTVQNTSTPEESACRKVNITLLGSVGAVTLPLSARGCTAGAFLFIGDEGIDGKGRDLSVFGCDFAKPQELTCRIRPGLVTVLLNDAEIFKHEKKIVLGNVVGFIIAIEGAGKVFDVKIR